MTLTVDLHHHAIPDFYRPASNEDGNAAGGIHSTSLEPRRLWLRTKGQNGRTAAPSARASESAVWMSFDARP
jgi:hypothetical protein